MRRWLLILAFFGVGFCVGGWFFSQTQRRPVLQLASCQTHCYNQKELLGILTSVGINHGSQFIPAIVRETDKTVVIKNPRPETKVDYLIIPKKDIKDPGDIMPADLVYVSDAYAVMAELIQSKQLTRYRIIANGPGYQDVSYLHFHLMSNQDGS